jgi:hypothetical protein
MVGHICNSSTQEAEKGGWRVQGQHRLVSKTEWGDRKKRKQQKEKEKKIHRHTHKNQSTNQQMREKERS